MSRLAYFFRETVISLRRNLMMTIAGIITVGISLCLFGGIRLVSTTVDHGTERWKHGVGVLIFMKNPEQQSQVEILRTALLADTTEIKSISFVDHNDALAEFKKDFKDQPALVENTQAADLPVSFRVVPTTASMSERIDTKFSNFVGVDTIITAQKQVKRLLAFTRWIKLFFYVISIALLLSSLFLIVNTIRLATFARRREIEVMKLVGASNWFVRVPFMAEGLVQGAIGAGFAFGFVWALKIVIANALSRQHNLLDTFRVTNSDAFGVGILILFVGAIIGTVGSAIGLRRFLEV